MKNFIVHCHKTKKIFDQPEIRKLFLQRLNDLMRQDYLQHVYQSESQDEIWMILNMEDIEILKMVMRPMSLEWSFELEIVPLRRNSEKL